ncbi:MAG: LiaF domain-containing protein [Armatimonadota bacterium]
MAWRYLIGLLIGLVSLGFILEMMYFPGLNMSKQLDKWWPLFIIALSGNYLLRRRENPWGTLLLIGLGIFLLVRQQSLDIYGMQILGFTVAVILLLFSLRLLLPRTAGKSAGRSGIPVMFRPSVKDLIVFGGSHAHSKSQQFQGGKVLTVMGDYELDLREAMLSPQGADLEVRALFGSVVVRIPPEMKFTVEGKPFLGSLDNRARSLVADEPGRPTLRLQLRATLSGVTLTN